MKDAQFLMMILLVTMCGMGACLYFMYARSIPCRSVRFVGGYAIAKPTGCYINLSDANRFKPGGTP